MFGMVGGVNVREHAKIVVNPGSHRGPSPLSKMVYYLNANYPHCLLYCVMQIVTTWYFKSTDKKTPYIFSEDYFSI